MPRGHWLVAALLLLLQCPALWVAAGQAGLLLRAQGPTAALHPGQFPQDPPGLSFETGGLAAEGPQEELPVLHQDELQQGGRF